MVGSSPQRSFSRMFVPLWSGPQGTRVWRWVLNGSQPISQILFLDSKSACSASSLLGVPESFLGLFSFSSLSHLSPRSLDRLCFPQRRPGLFLPLRSSVIQFPSGLSAGWGYRGKRKGLLIL